jgi:hypothetical protein
MTPHGLNLSLVDLCFEATAPGWDSFKTIPVWREPAETRYYKRISKTKGGGPCYGSAPHVDAEITSAIVFSLATDRAISH